MENIINNLNNIKARIWSYNSHEVSIIYYPMLDRYVARCEVTNEEKRITLKSAERVLNDMLYDFYVETA